MMHPASEKITFLAVLRNSIWMVGIVCWIFGLTDRSIASLADGALSAVDLVQLFTALVFFVGWLYLKPESRLKSESIK